MITTTIESLLSIKPILQKLANTSMPAREAFNILKTLKLVDKEYESIEAVQRQMLEKYGARNDDGNFSTDEKGNFIIKSELINEYVKEMQTFFDNKIELNNNPPTPISELNAAKIIEYNKDTTIASPHLFLNVFKARLFASFLCIIFLL